MVEDYGIGLNKGLARESVVMKCCGVFKNNPWGFKYNFDSSVKQGSFWVLPSI